LPHITDIFSFQYKCRTLSACLVSSGYKKSRAEHSGLARHRLKKKSLRHIKRVKIQMIATVNTEVLAAHRYQPHANKNFSPQMNADKHR
jgi:hypothetical protein